VSNPGRRLRSATIVIELSGKAPELFVESRADEMRPRLPWMWADRRMLEDIGRSGGSYVQRQRIENLDPGDSRSLTVPLNCRQPYRLISSWLEDATTD
jgi:hypothetical protein